MVGGIIHFLCMCSAGYVYVKRVQPNEMQKAIGLYIIVIFLHIVGNLGGTIATGVTGACVDLEACIYQENQDVNKAMAICILILHILSFFYSTSIYGEAGQFKPKPAPKKSNTTRTAAPPKTAKTTGTTPAPPKPKTTVTTPAPPKSKTTVTTPAPKNLRTTERPKLQPPPPPKSPKPPTPNNPVPTTYSVATVPSGGDMPAPPPCYERIMGGAYPYSGPETEAPGVVYPDSVGHV